ncbi:ABC transporter ATP-binding protein [Goodfellowiella coeruleoviolacea]|uniref:ATP-binding cassette, subfamily B n=1 Tax=Goodfellowiella coeruleoviolacea TaxID=334858 RepID=A0AAE3GJC1_9PSEU|nr:ABC transporter ATP-binding protein [Goodfellowiella coeruleoviolacea]MCP2169240.1 ATP-binding cassette, subfamily B [Goodfellowiella coeruleoviolacea]
MTQIQSTPAPTPAPTTAPAAGTAPTGDESWRGVAAEDVEELDRSTGLKLQARSRRLLGSLLRPHLWRALLAVVIVLAESLSSLLGPLLIAAAIDQGVPAALAGRSAPLAWCVGGYLGSGLLAALLRYAFIRLSGRIGQDLLLDLRQRVFRHAQKLSVSFHESYTSGKVVSRLTTDVDSLNDLLDMGLDGFLSSVISIVGIIGLLLWLDLPTALIVLAGFLPLVLLARWFQDRSRRAYRGTRGAVAKIIVQFVETMNGMRAVQAFRREARNQTILTDLNHQYRDANITAMTAVARFTGGVRLTGNISLVVVLAVGAWRVTAGTLDVGVLAAFTLYLRKFYDPFDHLAMFLNSYSAAAAALEKISGVLEEVPSVPEPVRPVPLPARTAGTAHPGTGTAGTGTAGTAGPGRGEVRFSRVLFRYSPDTPVVLPPLDLHVPAGQTVALVGATGAGKSTLVKLAARFYDPTEGAVTLDGVDLREVAEAELRRAVVMVTQENFLFSGSVADNIALGRPSASRAEVEAAAAAVGAHEFIAALPHGYDTDVRKRGGRLSAGQRQLVAFARAFLADPSVLVLDEATSSLDVPTERAVQSALETVLADRTAMIIAHRLSTVLIADRVLVVHNGQIVEDGSPRELIDSQGRFAALHRAWLDSLA